VTETLGLAPAGRVAPAPPVGLYVHVPFCLSLCPYCDFVVYAGAAARGPRSRINAFIGAVRTEIEFRADGVDRSFGPPGQSRRPKLDTLYLGGGTPSILPPDEVAGLIELVAERFGLASGAEVTIEANPGAAERGDAALLRAAGITRLSIGAQSLDAAELRRLGRRHRPEDVGDAVAAGRAAGIGSIGLDLLYDVPDQSAERWAATLEAALALEPDHLSLYALTLDDPETEGLTGATGDHLPTSSGARRWRFVARARQDDDRAAAQYGHATRRLAAAGFVGYEISNWARPGHESRHNLAYWLRRPYEGVGPGAHAFDRQTRRWNAARLDGYIAALAPTDGKAARLPPGAAEVIDFGSAAVEEVILGLRTKHGLPIEAAARPPLAGVFGWAIETGLVEMSTDRRVALTLRGRLLSNEVFARLL
jgi:oxygen-independent coproporphyrinogen-3 oxidase